MDEGDFEFDGAARLLVNDSVPQNVRGALVNETLHCTLRFRAIRGQRNRVNIDIVKAGDDLVMQALQVDRAFRAAPHNGSKNDGRNFSKGDSQ